jgi:hypothetical protein
VHAGKCSECNRSCKDPVADVRHSTQSIWKLARRERICILRKRGRAQYLTGPIMRRACAEAACALG